MNFRVGACALLVCLAGCSAEAPDARLGAQTGKAASQIPGQKLRGVQLERSAAQSIANAPDRGNLIEYKNKGAALKREGAYTWYPIAISEAHALKAVVTGEMTIPSPDGSQVKLKYERHEEQADGNWTWIGRVVGGDQMQEAIITFGEQAVYGSIPQSSGAPLSLQTRSGALYAVQTDLSKVKNPNTAATDMMVRPALALRSSLLSSATKAQVSQSATEKASSAATTVDVAIGYTQGFATAQGGASAAVTRLTYLIAVGNQAFENSLITGALRLVNSVQVDYVDNTTNQTALEDLTGVRNDQAITVPTGLAPLRTAREQYGADLAVLVRKFQTPENDGCGIAWLNGAGQTAIDPTVDDDYAFAVISDGSDAGTDGNSYFCAEETLVHEVGHLMGSAHDRDNSKTSTGALLYGRYPYSFGMKTAESAGNFYTIMAYGSNNQNFYRTFSNPLVLKCGPAGNLTCGVTDQTDNARSLNQTISVVARFRATIVPFSNVLDLSVIRKSGGASGKTEVHSMNGNNNFQTYTRNLASGLYPTPSDKSWAFLFGDYNGDGTTDLYLVSKMGASGKTEVHVLNGANGFSTFLVNTTTALHQTGTDNRWVFRLGDINADGRLDLYAISRMGSSGRTEVHVLNGANGFQTFLTQIATILPATGSDLAWDFGLGDRNGDGFLDLFVIKKVGASDRTEIHILNGANNFQTYLSNIASVLHQTGTDNRWNFKVGDFNRDGIADVYAINKAGGSGKVEVHVMNGDTGFQSYLANISTLLYAVGTDNAWEFELTPTAATQ